jgi:hypothetical protein
MRLAEVVLMLIGRTALLLRCENIRRTVPLLQIKEQRFGLDDAKCDNRRRDSCCEAISGRRCMDDFAQVLPISVTTTQPERRSAKLRSIPPIER